MIDLATQIARDGEGAQKLITIDVTGAASARAARKIGLSIANSPLFKTMVAAGDPNWGRIVMAVGKAGEKADRDLLSITIGGACRSRSRAPRWPTTTRRRSNSTWRAATCISASISASAAARRGCGPAT